MHRHDNTVCIWSLAGDAIGNCCSYCSVGRVAIAVANWRLSWTHSFMHYHAEKWRWNPHGKLLLLGQLHRRYACIPPDLPNRKELQQPRGVPWDCYLSSLTHHCWACRKLYGQVAKSHYLRLCHRVWSGSVKLPQLVRNWRLAWPSRWVLGERTYAPEAANAPATNTRTTASWPASNTPP